MIQQTASLLRSIWKIPSWRDELLTTFERWAQDGASRSEAAGKLKALIEVHCHEPAISCADNIDPERVNWSQLTEFLCLCFYRRRLRSPLPTVPSDELWMKLSETHSYGPLSPHPQQEKAIKETVPVPLFPLEQKLLTLGGQRMVYRHEPDLASLLSRGEAFDGPAELIPGESRQCHSNVAQLWHENKKTFAIVTGYALSKDGLWRQHSWLLRKKPEIGQYRVLETTIRREKYFGFVLTDSEAENFYSMN